MIRFNKISIVIYLGCGLFSCNSKTDQSDKAIFKYNEHANISSLDPAFAQTPNNIWALHQLFNGLVQLDSTLKVTPDIAKKWTISSDAKTYRFILRDDVQYHKHSIFGRDSTRTVVAKDFVYSFDRLLDEQIASPGRWTLNDVKSYQAINDTILSIQLNKPFPGFLGLLSTKYCSVVPKEVVDEYGSSFGEHPIGTGPFYFKIWKKNIKLVLLKNRHYHEYDFNGNQLPYLDAINVTFLPDKQSEFLEFIKGNVDMISGLDISYKDELLTPKGNLQPNYKDKIKLLTAPYLNTEYIGIYMDSHVDELQSISFRKALNYGFDRQKIITYLRNGLGIPAIYGMIPKGLLGSSTTAYFSYDLVKARQLLQNYIQKSGNTRPSLKISTNANYLDICEYLQSAYEKVGIATEVDLLTPSVLKQSKSTGKIDTFRASWIADYPEAENYMSLFYSKNFTPKGSNYTHFQNKKFDKLYEASFTEIDPIRRGHLYQKMDSIIMSAAPVIPLYYDKIVRFVSKDIIGMHCNPINLLDLKKVQKNINSSKQ